MSWNRRQILLGASGTAALASVGTWALGRAWRTAPPKRDEGDELASLVDALLAATESECLDVAAGALARGVSPRGLLEAALLLPLVSGGDPSDIHAMASVPAVLHLTGEAQDAAERIPVLWAVTEAHAWSGRARLVLNADAPENPGARADADLILRCAQPHADPHVAIWAAQAERMRAVWTKHEAPLLASVRAYEDRHARMPASAPPLRIDDADTTSAAEIARALRDAAQTPVDGVSSHALFEALALLSGETRLTDDEPTGLGVHQTTLLDALWRIHDGAAPATRPGIAAHALQWLLLLVQSHGRRLPAPITDLTELAGDPFALARHEPLRGYRAALAATARDERTFLSTVRARLLERGDDAHDFKYWDAVVSIADRLAGANRARWLATLVAADTVRTDAHWSQRERALALLQKNQP